MGIVNLCENVFIAEFGSDFFYMWNFGNKKVKETYSTLERLDYQRQLKKL